MNILLIGGGAREHAIAKSIKQSLIKNHLIYCAPNNNPGIDQVADLFIKSNITDKLDILRAVKNKNICFAVIGPEAPLAAGLADEFNKMNIPCIGPTQALAQIETSKGFARDLMQKHQIDGLLKYKRFDHYDKAGILKTLHEYQSLYAIKDDGLCGGKGVKLFGEHLQSDEEALHFCKAINGPFVIEEKCYGLEFSLISFCDGKTIHHCPPVQDHKRAYNNDLGPNTGGMGSYTLSNHKLPFLNDKNIKHAQEINTAVYHALQSECNAPYIGFLYGGFMLTKEGVKVIEYNARLGDPEAINLLSTLETDFVSLCLHMISGLLKDVDISFKNIATVVKYIVPNGYPIKSEAGHLSLKKIINHNQLFYGAISHDNDKLLMTGSRALAVIGTGHELKEAEKNAKKTIKRIKGPAFYRKDIGTKKLMKRYQKLAEEINV